MDHNSFFALYGMFCLGLLGIMCVTYTDGPKWIRIGGFIWAVIWMSPPLFRLWIAGVSG